MGFYDTMLIPVEKLPVSLPEQVALKEKKFQTKSFASMFKTVQITEEGRLLYLLDEQIIELNFHGICNFYTSIGERDYTFYAKFTDGQLIEITEYPPENYELLQPY